MPDHPVEIKVAVEAMLAAWFDHFNIPKAEKDEITARSCNIVARLIAPLIERDRRDAVEVFMRGLQQADAAAKGECEGDYLLTEPSLGPMEIHWDAVEMCARGDHPEWCAKDSAMWCRALVAARAEGASDA